MNAQLSENTCRNDIKSILVAVLEKLDDADLASTAKLSFLHYKALMVSAHQRSHSDFRTTAAGNCLEVS